MNVFLAINMYSSWKYACEYIHIRIRIGMVRTSARLDFCSFFRSLVRSSARSLVRRFVRPLARPFVGSSVSLSVRPSVRPRGRRRACRETGNAVAGSSGRSGDSNFCRNLRNGHHLVRSSRAALFFPLAIESTNGSSSNACCSKWIRSLLCAFLFRFPSLHLLLLLLLLLVALQSWGGREQRDEPRETAGAMKNETTSCCFFASCGASTPSFGTTT